jgi:RHS repeat-associated protein
MDNQSRIALVRVGKPFANDTTPAVKYYVGDHLGSSNLVLDGTGDLVNREEYTPYGETSFGSFARKRYRFSGKERDEESGLANFGARYYAAWVGRWLSCDPAGRIDGDNLYRFTRGNPIRFADALGYAGNDKSDPAATLTEVAQTQQTQADTL